MKITMDKIIEVLEDELGEYISNFETFRQCHNVSEFIGFDEKSGVEFFARQYLIGYAQSWYAVELEDAGYWGEDE